MIIPVYRYETRSTAKALVERFVASNKWDNTNGYRYLPEIKLESLKHVLYYPARQNMVMTDCGYADLSCWDAQKVIDEELAKQLDGRSFVVLNKPKAGCMTYYNYASDKDFVLIKSQMKTLTCSLGLSNNDQGTIIVFENLEDKVLCNLSKIFGKVVKDEK